MFGSKIKTLIAAAGFALVIAGAVIVYNLLSGRMEAPNTVNTNNSRDQIPAPDFSMIDIEGNTVKLSDMIGKPVVLNFWASWCQPCRVEMPFFDDVWKELGDEVHFMMLCLVDGGSETVESGTAYILRQGFSFPVYFDTGWEGSRAYGIRSIPTTVFINSDGYLVTGVQGTINESTLRRGIELIR